VDNVLRLSNANLPKANRLGPAEENGKAHDLDVAIRCNERAKPSLENSNPTPIEVLINTITGYISPSARQERAYFRKLPGIAGEHQPALGGKRRNQGQMSTKIHGN
jgi:hypothetical protein